MNKLFKAICEYAKDKRNIKRLNCMFDFCMEKCKDHIGDKDGSEYNRYAKLVGEIIDERLNIMCKSYF